MITKFMSFGAAAFALGVVVDTEANISSIADRISENLPWYLLFAITLVGIKYLSDDMNNKAKQKRTESNNAASIALSESEKIKAEAEKLKATEEVLRIKGETNRANAEADKATIELKRQKLQVMQDYKNHFGEDWEKHYHDYGHEFDFLNHKDHHIFEDDSTFE